MDEIIEILKSLLKQISDLQTSVSFATVAGVYSDGVTLAFDGQSGSSTKHYKTNAGAVFKTGDRVKVTKSFGTYVVDFVVGAPGASVPRELPSGGTDGQVLTKDGTTNYSVKWASAPGLPAGGTNGQFLVKDSSITAGAKWSDAPHELPTGGSNGQVLTKNGSTNYSVKWDDAPHELPTGGTSGQVLTKDGSTNYSVKWDTPSVGALKNGSYTVTLDASRNLVPSLTGTTYGFNIGTSSAPFKNIYTSAGTLSFGANTIGFFGTTPAARQTVSNTATVATLITALKKYGLIA